MSATSMMGITTTVSDGSQPPMRFDLALSESAGSRSLHRSAISYSVPIGIHLNEQCAALKAPELDVKPIASGR
jgi:hypothetical protein